MKACVFDEFGNSSKLTIREVEKPRPNEAEILVKIIASGLNPVDWKIREGLFAQSIPHRFPVIPGWEMAGVIEETGFGARRFGPGDEVYGCCRRPVICEGTYAEYISIPESYVSLKPYTLSFEEAAAFPLCGLTAYQCLYDTLRTGAGETILILGASGGVGTFAVQLAKIANARVIAIASGSNLDYVKQLGADHVFAYDAADYPGVLEPFALEGIPSIFDCVGKRALSELYDFIRPGSRVVSIVNRHPEPALAEKKIDYHYVFVEPNSRELDRLSELADDSQVRVHVSRRFSLDEAALAQDEMAGGHTRGKLVIDI
jgi:NADPH:quinone reductase-like Zn-dependent oxidoreductase